MQIKKIFFIIFLLSISAIYAMKQQFHTKEFILVLDPAGDAKRTGRAIGDAFERGLTLQCAEKIKSLLEERCSYIKVVITRLPGDSVYDLQNASLSNRINADLFISLHFYQTQDTKPTLFLYQFSYGNDFATHNADYLALNTYDQAYKINKYTTDNLAHLFRTQLTQQRYVSLFSLSGPHALPIKPLIGITAPGIALEAGLKNKEAWHLFAEPLTDAIMAVIEKLN